MGVVVGRVGDWPENEAGEGVGRVSIAGMEHHRAKWTGIAAQKERWLKARLEFPSILSGGKFSCSLVHDFRANEYRGQGIRIKESPSVARTRMLVAQGASVILPRIYASAYNAA